MNNNVIAARALRLLAGSALLLAAGLAQAQYVWIGENGIKHFSDRPPAPSTPLRKILKAPGLQPAAIEPPAAGDARAAEPAKAAPKPPALADREADFRKRAKERTERDQKAAEQAQQTADQRANCASARETRQELDSGARIGTTTQNGERGFMGDAERAQRSAKVNRILEGCRQAP